MARDLSETDLELMKTLITSSEESLVESPRVLLVGSTGCGKTTLLHSLIGHNLVCTEESGMFLRLTPDDKMFSVYHGADTETRIANIFHDKEHSVVYCDCPGFCWNDPFQAVVNAYTFERLFKEPCKIKILLVMNVNELCCARGEMAKEAFDTVCKLVQDENGLQQSVGLVITQAEKNVDVFMMLNRLRCLKWQNNLVDYFLDSAEGKEKVFVFPRPEKPGSYDLFADRNRVIDFVINAPSMVNPEHGIVFNERATSMISELVKQFHSEIKKALIKYVAAISEISSPNEEAQQGASFELSMENVRKWVTVIEELKNACNLGLMEFCKCAQKTKELCDALSAPVSRVESIIPWINFKSTMKEIIPVKYSEKMDKFLDEVLENLSSVEETITEEALKMFESQPEYAEMQRKMENLVNEIKEKQKEEQKKLEEEIADIHPCPQPKVEIDDLIQDIVDKSLPSIKDIASLIPK